MSLGGNNRAGGSARRDRIIRNAIVLSSPNMTSEDIITQMVVGIHVDDQEWIIAAKRVLKVRDKYSDQMILDAVKACKARRVKIEGKDDAE